MHEFNSLMEIVDALHGSEGCPWTRKQTLKMLLPYILEEAHEVVEAIENDDEGQMIEELGDLLYIVLFCAKRGKEEKRFSMETILENLKAKLMRRHPHVFGDVKANSMEEVVRAWEKVKKEEKKDRKDPFEGIPKTMPSLQRAQKILQKIQGYHPKKHVVKSEDLAKQILEIVQRANEAEVDLESALRQLLNSFQD